MRDDPLLKLRRDAFAYRIAVGIALFDRSGHVWLGRRLPKWAGDTTPPFWQMPQGGITKGELPAAAARRELYEETGTRSFSLIAEFDSWLTYDLPDDLLGVALKGRYRGQRQLWFAARFEGEDRDFDITGKNSQKPEFNAWKWGTLDEAVAGVVPWKTDVYKAVAAAFGDLARSG